LEPTQGHLQKLKPWRKLSTGHGRLRLGQIHLSQIVDPNRHPWDNDDAAGQLGAVRVLLYRKIPGE